MALPYVDPAVSARIADTRAQLAQHRAERTRIQSHIDAVKKTIPNTGDVLGSAEFRQVEGLLKDARDVDLKISSLQQQETYLLGNVSGLDGVGRRESFLSDPNVCEDLRSLAGTSQPVGDRFLGIYKDRDTMLAEFAQRRDLAGFGDRANRMAAAGDVTLPSDAARTRYYGAVEALRRPLRILDLIPTQPMDTGTFSYVQESSSGSNAAETAELTVKPSGTVTLTDATCKAATIPEWIRISRNTLADVPGLGTILENQLQWDVESRLESEILAGNGTGQNITGIVHTSGIGAPASVTGDTTNSDLVLNGVANVIESFAIPNAVVMNPADVVKAIKLKASGSGERLDSSGAFSSLPTSMWGLPLVQSVAQAAGTALIGDFQRGATLFLREGFSIRISDSDSTDFVSNAVKLLGELRAGLAVWRPSCFANVTLSFTA